MRIKTAYMSHGIDDRLFWGATTTEGEWYAIYDNKYLGEWVEIYNAPVGDCAFAIKHSCKIKTITDAEEVRRFKREFLQKYDFTDKEYLEYLKERWGV